MLEERPRCQQQGAAAVPLQGLLLQTVDVPQVATGALGVGFYFLILAEGPGSLQLRLIIMRPN